MCVVVISVRVSYRMYGLHVASLIPGTWEEGQLKGQSNLMVATCPIQIEGCNVS